MAPTEQIILRNYLLVPAQLPAIISLQEFVALFPRQLQSSPRIRTLYRDLQSQRNAVVDDVAGQVEQEAKHGKAMRRAVIRSKREAEEQEQDEEVEIERMVSLGSDLVQVETCVDSFRSWETGPSHGTQNTRSPLSFLTWRAPSVGSRPSCSSSKRKKPLS